MKTTLDYNTVPTTPGWYYVGFAENKDRGIFLQLEEGCWFNEEGDEVYSLFDCFLNMEVSVDAADFYVPQS